MIQGNDIMESMYKQKDKPQFKDHCNHPDNSYIGSIQDVDGNWLDIYVYKDATMKETTVCIRFGDEGQEYYSPGNIVNVITSKFNPYFLAMCVINKKGRITYERNK